ncbi:MAG: hypothetical protein EA427_01970 [Spirochaetaceae bacterium]|nr:MAG: hypothetical protein EA427_01970 [Spirochaetaceae bacterium]
MADLGYLIIGGVLWNNIIVTHLLGLFPFLGEQPPTVRENGILGLLTTVTILVSLSAGLILRPFVLDPLGIHYMEHLVIVLLVPTVAAILQIAGRRVDWFPAHLLPRIFLNGAALGVVILKLESGSGAVESLVTAFGMGLGFTVLLILVRAIETRPETTLVPVWLRGMPLQFITLGMIALALKGLSGI